MKSKSLIEFFSNFAVFAGLILVAYQINQSTVLTRAQLNSDASGRIQAMQASLQSENFAAVYAKSLSEPSKLTMAELRELDAHYNRLIDHLVMDRFFFQLGIFEVEPQEFISWHVPGYFSNRFALSWWKVNRNGFNDSEFVGLMDREIAKLNPDGDVNYYETLQRELSN